MAFRKSIFAWLSERLRFTDSVTRDDLSRFEFAGARHRLVGTQTGIRRVKAVSDAAVSILTSYADDVTKRPYDDVVGDDGLLRCQCRRRPATRWRPGSVICARG